MSSLDKGYFTEQELAQLGFATFGSDCKISRNCAIIGAKNVRLGSHVRIDDYVVISAASGSLLLGSYIHIAVGAYLGCAGGITMADFSGVSHGAKIYSASDDYSGAALTNPTVPKKYLNVDVAPVLLGRHAIVGAGSIVLPGVILSEGTAVGAMTLIKRGFKTDDWAVYFGAPARKVADRSKALLALEAALLAEELQAP
jgi:acetyltransferase-like isoleucine patch superfamily enzyme